MILMVIIVYFILCLYNFFAISVYKLSHFLRRSQNEFILLAALKILSFKSIVYKSKNDA